GIPQAAQDPLEPIGHRRLRALIYKTDSGDFRRPLCIRRERPHDRCATDKDDKFAPPHRRAPDAQTAHRTGSHQRERIKLLLSDSNVRFGSKADICGATSHVRFAPNSDRESRHPGKVMSALHPKADMCGAIAYVCYGPKADITLSSDL